jgi:hypothetical protein
MTERQFEIKYGVSFETAIKSKETVNGVDFFVLPTATTVAVNWNGCRFAILKPYKRPKWREKAIRWALEQFEKDTLKPVEKFQLA